MKPGDYDSLINDLALARNRDFTDKQVTAIKETLSSIAWVEAVKIVKDLTRLPSLPQNIYGAILSRVEEFEYSKKKKLEFNEKWTADKDCMTANEFMWLFKIITEAQIWYHEGLVEKNPNGCTESMTVEQWIARGRPLTWSPVIDHLLKGSEVAYKATIGGNPKALEIFWAEFYSTLVTTRAKRTNCLPQAI